MMGACRIGLRRFAKDFWQSRAGGTAMFFAMLAPALFGFGALTFDLVSAFQARSSIQQASDAAALAAARELQLANVDPMRVSDVARSYAMSQLGSSVAPGSTSVVTNVVTSNRTVEVKISYQTEPGLGRTLGLTPPVIGARSVARLTGSVPICVIGLDANGEGTLNFDNNALLTANRCAVYSNSTDKKGVTADRNALVTAALTCSAGGIKNKGKFVPDALTDCPKVADPLLSRAAPSVGPCTEMNKVISGGVISLMPGVYCGGLTIKGGARVTFRPGIYAIKDGAFLVDDARIDGQYVGFYLQGEKTTINFKSASTINLTAPRDGALSGLLFFEDRATTPKRTHQITSDNARTLLGTIYLAQGRLFIDANKPLADQSAYTVIVARSLDLQQGPNLVLNSDYGASDVPVPNGLGPNVGGQTVLDQ